MKSWLNTTARYGWGSILLHWTMAVALIAMYFLGEYMVDLDYYDTWYHKAPALHKAVGAILGMALVLRLAWNFAQQKPAELSDIPIIKLLAKLGQGMLYALIALMVISGYLISTAKGQGIDVFGWFEIPALLADNAEGGELAGKVHALLGSVFILLVGVHTLAALLHHFVFQDRTLKRMLWVQK